MSSASKRARSCWTGQRSVQTSAILAAILALILAGLACGSAPRQLNLYPTLTPNATATIPFTQTPRIVQVEVTAPLSPTPPPTAFVSYRATVRAHSWYCYDKPYGDPLPGSLRAGQLVTVIENTGGWAELEADGARPACWVVSAALQ